MLCDSTIQRLRKLCLRWGFNIVYEQMGDNAMPLRGLGGLEWVVMAVSVRGGCRQGGGCRTGLFSLWPARSSPVLQESPQSWCSFSRRREGTSVSSAESRVGTLTLSLRQLRNQWFRQSKLRPSLYNLAIILCLLDSILTKQSRSMFIWKVKGKQEKRPSRLLC